MECYGGLCTLIWGILAFYSIVAYYRNTDSVLFPYIYSALLFYYYSRDGEFLIGYALFALYVSPFY